MIIQNLIPFPFPWPLPAGFTLNLEPRCSGAWSSISRAGRRRASTSSLFVDTDDSERARDKVLEWDSSGGLGGSSIMKVAVYQTGGDIKMLMSFHYLESDQSEGKTSRRSLWEQDWCPGWGDWSARREVMESWWYKYENLMCHSKTLKPKTATNTVYPDSEGDEGIRIGGLMPCTVCAAKWVLNTRFRH